jgi:rare lipoprotein A
VFAAIAALLCGAASAALCGVGTAAADEASVKTAAAGRALSSAVGVSSYYGPGFHGLRTADGEIFDRYGLSAAHKSFPLPCYARVTNLSNGRSLVVRVNDRGPFVRGRALDVSERAARLLEFKGGLARVRIDYLGKAGAAGPADLRALMASLKTGAEPVAVAKAKPAEDGVSVAERSTPALGYSAAAPRAPAAAALEAAVRPVSPPAAEALGLAAKLDASLRQLQEALETGRQSAQRAAKSLSPYGDLVVAPFKPLLEAAR